MGWVGKLFDIGFGGLPKAAVALCPDHLKRQWRERLNDHNPFKTISANHDLVRATRLAWIEAAQEVLAKSRQTAAQIEWQSSAATIQTFDELIAKMLVVVRDHALDRRTAPGPSPIDAHMEDIIAGVPEFVSTGSQENSGRSVTGGFTETLAALSGWSILEVPPVFGQTARAGLAPRGGGTPRPFGELVFASFAELIKDPKKYPQAREAFYIAMDTLGRDIGTATLTAVQGLDAKLDDAIAGLDGLDVLRTGALNYLDLLPGMAATIDATHDKITTLKIEGARQHEEILAAVAREKGIDPEHLRPILERLGHTDTPASDIPRMLSHAVDDLISRAGSPTVIHNDGPAMDEAIRTARSKLATADTVGAIAVLDAALDDDSAFVRALEAEEEAHKNRVQLGRARARGFFEKAFVQLTSFDHDGAIESMEQGLQLDPDNFWRWIELGDEFLTIGNTPNALDSYNTARDAAHRTGDERDLSVSYERIGDVEVAQGDLEAALKSFQEGIAIRERLAASDAGNAGWQRDLSASYVKIGDVEVALGNIEVALKSFQEGLAIAERLAASDAENAGWQRDLSVSYERIGNLEETRGNIAAAISAYERSLPAAQSLADRFPDHRQFQNDILITNRRLTELRARLK